MPQYDILAMGNAIVDVISSETPDFLSSRGIEHGFMRLIDAAEAGALYGAMGPGREISGGSAANSVVGAAALGARTAFVGRVAGDRLGHVFTHDIRAAGVAFDTAAATGGPPTGRCLIWMPNWWRNRAFSIWKAICGIRRRRGRPCRPRSRWRARRATRWPSR